MVEIKSSKAEKAGAPEAPETKKRTERWVSTAARSHMVTGRDADGTVRCVKFSNWALDLDLDDPEQKRESDVLRSSPVHGTQIFEVNGKYPGHPVGSDVEQLRRLRQMISGEDEVSRQAGLEKLRAIFTREELSEAGQSYLTEDVDALIMLAIKLKKNI